DQDRLRPVRADGGGGGALGQLPVLHRERRQPRGSSVRRSLRRRQLRRHRAAADAAVRALGAGRAFGVGGSGHGAAGDPHHPAAGGKSSSSCQRMLWGRSKVVRVARPSAMVRFSRSTSFLACQASWAAGAWALWTPMTLIFGLTVLATRQAPAAPLPPPMGTIITPTSGRLSTISRVCVATPAMSSGSSPEDR